MGTKVYTVLVEVRDTETLKFIGHRMTNILVSGRTPEDAFKEAKKCYPHPVIEEVTIPGTQS